MASKKNVLSGPEDWQVESDLRTMIEAEQIEKDRSGWRRSGPSKERMMQIASSRRETE